MQDVSKSYGVVNQFALSEIDFGLESGEIVGLVGRNGSGKSTLMAIAAGARYATSGDVFIEGEILDKRHRRACRSIGYAPQEEALYPNLTAEQNVGFACRLRRLRQSKNDQADAVRLAMAMTRIEDLATTPVRFLSVGQRRRVQLAAAIVGSPSLLLLDEPTAGVDLDSRQVTLDAVKRLADEGAAVCYSTHILGEVEMLATRLMVLRDGMIVADEPYREAAGQLTKLVFEFRSSPPDLSAFGGKVTGTSVSIDCEDLARTIYEVVSFLGPEADLVGIDHRQAQVEEIYRRLGTREQFPPENLTAAAR